MSDSGHSEIRSYMRQLDEALANAPSERRREIVDEVKVHIDEEMQQLGRPATEAEVRQILDRLGEPLAIADAVADDAPTQEPAPTRSRSPRLGLLEVAALVLLLIGALIVPVVGWVAGVVLLWISPAWTTKQKWLGTLVVPGGLALPLFLSLFSGGGEVCEVRSEFHVRPSGKHRFIDEGAPICESTALPVWLMTALMVALVIAAIAVPIYLGRKATKDAAAEGTA